MEIADFDMKILKSVAEITSGKTQDELVSLFGKEALTALDSLLGNQLVTIHEHDMKTFMGPGSNYVDPPIGNIIATDIGKLEVKRWKTKRMLTNREKWVERAVGFFSGAAISVLGGLILKLFVG